MKRFSRAVCLSLSVVAAGCSVKLTQSGSTNIVKNQCAEDSECGSQGACWFGACVAHEGVLSSLLLELTPPVGTQMSGIGGVHFLQMENGFERSNEQHDLDLAGVSTVHGYIKGACPFDVTLTPEEQSFGLSALTYVTHTTAAATSNDTGVAASGACSELTLSGATQEFVVNVPPGTFDVYLRPSSASGSGATQCDAVPQLLHGIIKAAPGVICYSPPAPIPQKLDVLIPWPEDAPPLEGWTVDVLHPTTGVVLSKRADPLHGAPSSVGSAFYYPVSVNYSQAVGDDTAGQELLRLSPPTPDAGPVVQFSIAGLVPMASGGTQKALPAIGPFPDKVTCGGWVWAADDFANGNETPVPSTVTLTATDLELPASGIFASFSTTTMVGDDGRISVELFPGTYRVREVPTVGRQGGRHLAAQESTWTVSASKDGSGLDQGGRVVLVKTAANVAGRALSALRGDIGGASVEAISAAIDTRRCENPDAGTCASQPVGVLEMSLAQSAFVPRTASGLTAGDGRFSLPDVDCGGCEMGSPAVFDVTVLSTDGTRLPWVLKPGVEVQGDVDLGELRATLPILQRGTVGVPDKNRDLSPVPGTLIRAYVLRDATGAPVLDPTGLTSCADGSYAGAATKRCIRSALQIAETHADDSGNYELALPSSLDAITPQ